ncbi:hypothetical protein [Aliikangiella maris]|uniref:Uncharacterized protein n=2 Tax=Aliikangiella maris TaxID=3162458 RepID=A0ABV2BRY5_9GAMM
MLANKPLNSLTRRHSKLLAELIIGIIGVFGIMLAEIDSKDRNHLVQFQNQQSVVMKVSPSKIDWLEVLFN